MMRTLHQVNPIAAPRRRRTRAIAAGLAATLALAGCAGSSDATAPTTEEPTTTDAPTPAAVLEETCEAKTRRVLVVGIDGLRPDGLAEAETPALDSVAAAGTSTERGYAGGELGTPTEQATSSGPGWASILTGVWVDDHRITNNEFATWDQGAPHFFERVREVQPDARLSSMVQWIPLRVMLGGTADRDEIGSGRVVTDHALDELATQDPTVLFVHLDDVDHAGHATGYGPENPDYVQAVEGVDALTGEILAAIEARPGRTDECWATVVVTDHGGIDTGHGGQTNVEREIPMLVGGDGLEVAVVSGGPGHVVVPPTVLAYLGHEIDPAWGWVGEPFGVAQG